jgi:hypothetical protein
MKMDENSPSNSIMKFRASINSKNDPKDPKKD